MYKKKVKIYSNIPTAGSNIKVLPVHSVKAYGGVEVQILSFLISALVEYRQVSPFHRPRRPVGRVEVQLYSIFDLGTRRGEGSASRPGRTLPPGKIQYPFYRRLGGFQDRSGQVRKISPPPGFDPRTIKPVGSRYNDYATRPTLDEDYWLISHGGLHFLVERVSRTGWT